MENPSIQLYDCDRITPKIVEIKSTQIAVRICDNL